MHAVHDAQEVHPQHLTPAVVGLPRLAEPAPDAGVVHQHGHVAEGVERLLLQTHDLLEPADVGGHGADVGGAAPGQGDHLGGGLVQPIASAVGQHQLHAQRCETLGGGEADAAGGAGDHRRAAGREGRMGHWISYLGRLGS